MADNGKDRLDKLEEIAAILLEHAQIAEKRLDNSETRLDLHQRQIETLHTVAKETNERIASLVSAIGEYIRNDREQRGL
jgi:hypothetical protein